MNGVLGVPMGVVATTPGSTLAQILAGGMVILPIAALAIYGWFHGIFLAVIAGLQVLLSFVIALTWSRSLASILEICGCPPGHSLALAFWAIFVVSIVAIWIVIRRGVPEGVVRFNKLADHCGGAALGVVAGGVLGGALLVGWSLTNGPSSMRFEADRLPFDGGRRMLWTFARWTTPSEAAAALLVTGDTATSVRDQRAKVRASEPFVDMNGNNTYDGIGTETGEVPERYLDLDGNDEFTMDLEFVDHNGDGQRTLGLSDCYRLGDWRRSRSQHAPRIISPDSADVTENAPVEDMVYEAKATDADGDAITFTIERIAVAGNDPKDDEGQAPALDVFIDSTTGVVKLIEVADFERHKKHEFVLVATDSTGLTARQTVRLRVRDVPLESKVAP